MKRIFFLVTGLLLALVGIGQSIDPGQYATPVKIGNGYLLVSIHDGDKIESHHYVEYWNDDRAKK